LTTALLVVLILLLLAGGILRLDGTIGISTWGVSSFSRVASPPEGGVFLGDNAVTIAAKEMAAHLNNSCLGHNPGCAGYASFDSGFPPDILEWGNAHCPGCEAWKNGSFQCVAFILAAYSRLHPLPFDGNAWTWWGTYSGWEARALGYRTIPARDGGMPLSPGDIMVWFGGQFGHVTLVLGWQEPKGDAPGVITFAGANGQLPIQSLPLLPDGRIDTQNGYWNNFTVVGYIHPSFLPIRTGSAS
jgi:hypothetical protein